MFSKPTSRWENLSHKLGDVAEVVGDKASYAAGTLGHAALAVGHVASAAGHSVAAKASSFRHEPSALEKLGNVVSELPIDHLKGNVLEAAGNVRESVADVASRGWSKALSSAEIARIAAEAARHKAGDAIHNFAERTGDKSHDVKNRAADASDSAKSAAHFNMEKAAASLSLVQQLSAKKARKTAKRAVAEHNELSNKTLKLVSCNDDSSSKLLWLLGGILIGALVALLLTPSTGRRSRALIKDKLGKAGRGVAGAGSVAKTRATDLSRRAAGKIHEKRNANAPDDADDIIIAQRVRTTLGENPATRNMERLNIDCVNGIVTIRGPIADDELQAQIEKIVRSVKGVSDVQSFLLHEESPEDQATFVG